jgi:Family of unknown function (DUF5681)
MTEAERKKAALITYEVGYGKPPVHTRFRKGQSGNPSGRPKRTATERAKDIALQEAYRLVPVRDGDKIVKMPAIQAVHRSQIALAAKGNGPAQRAVLRVVQAIEKEGHDLNMELLQAAIEYKAMANRDAERRRRLGITYVDPNAPHPDDLVISMHTGEVIMCHEDFGHRPKRRRRK